MILAALVAALAALFGSPSGVPAAASPVAYNYDTAAYTYNPPVMVSTPDAVVTTPRGSPAGPAAASWVSRVSGGRFGVAANTAGADVVLYSPQVASRNLLGQVGEGFATTPGGRTVSAHAADRIVNGAAGRLPTTLGRVDDILDNPSALRYDPLRDTVRVSQGKDFVVVRGSGQGQHTVTVMVP